MPTPRRTSPSSRPPRQTRAVAADAPLDISPTVPEDGVDEVVDSVVIDTEPVTKSLKKATAKKLLNVVKYPSDDPWIVQPGDQPKLIRIEPGSTPAAPGDRAATEAASVDLRARLVALQNRLRAEEQHSVLLVLQAMDAGGKDGTIKSVFAGVDPMGVEVTAFNVPTAEELGHDFLWRIHRRTPRHGFIGIFNRSHYEDVLAVRVRNLAPEKVWRGRYGLIRDFEKNLSEAGTTVIKIMLHISFEEQALRLQERIDDSTKRWKFRIGDLDDRKLWHDYQRAYEETLAETSTHHAPWYVVPANRKWYRNWAVLTILVEALEKLDPQFPPRPDLDGLNVEEYCASKE